MRVALVWLGLILGLCGLPAHAQAIFDQFGGTWAPLFDDQTSCAQNPHSITFSPDHQSATFEWQNAITFFTGQQETAGTYRVVSPGGDRISLAIAGETRLTAEGVPVVWILRLVQDGRAYCWGRTDWPAEQCESLHYRCPDPIPNS